RYPPAVASPAGPLASFGRKVYGPDGLKNRRRAQRSPPINGQAPAAAGGPFRRAASVGCREPFAAPDRGRISVFQGSTVAPGRRAWHSAVRGSGGGGGGF